MSKAFKMVHIVWEDACSVDEWLSLGDIKEVKPTICTSTGYLILKDKQRVIIAMNIHPDGPELRGSCIMAIPAKNVRQFKIVG